MIVEALFTMLIAVAVLNVWASWRVVTDELDSWLQRVAQLAFVWLIPVIGALLTVQLKKRHPEQGKGAYGEVPDIGDDLGYLRTATRHTSGSDAEPSDNEPPSHD